jgi:hypothetical protein
MKKLRFLCITNLIIVLTGVLSGCAEKEAPPVIDIPAHFTTYTEDGLFSISYPAYWETAFHIIEGVEHAVTKIITSIESDIPVEKASEIFLAGLPIEAGYLPNVSVWVESLLGIILTHDNMVEAEIKSLKTIITDLGGFSQVKTTVGGRTMTIIEYEGTFPRVGKFHWLQMFTLVGKTTWIVTCASSLGEFNKCEEDFNAIVRSLRIEDFSAIVRSLRILE